MDQIAEVASKSRSADSERRSRGLKLFELVYGGEIDREMLLRAVENRPIPPRAADKWQCDGIRKAFAGQIDLQKKNDREMATAISRRISRFRFENEKAYNELSTSERLFMDELHRETGARIWEEEELLGSKLSANAELVASFGMDFSKTPSDELNQKLTGKGLVSFRWKNCDHDESRRATSINTSLNEEKAPQCSICRRIDSSFISWYENNRPFLEDESGLDISKLSEEDLMDSAYSKRTFLVTYGCGDSERTTFSSLKAKHKRALEMGQDRIVCNGCKVADGTFEVGIRMALQFAQALVPGLIVERQVEIEGLPRMPFDIRITTPQGMTYYIEIDGGYHYRGHTGSDGGKFLKKIEADRKKTEVVLLMGDRMIRVDERNHRGELQAELSGVLLQAVYGTLPVYTVVGEECPGAQQVSSALKGWA